MVGEDVGTVVLPSVSQRRSRQDHRALVSRKCNGAALVISTGASAALRKKSDSLLPEGVMDVVGEFEPGDVVELRDRVGRVLGRGLANYRSSDCVQLVGKSVADIGPTLGWRGCVALHAVAARGLAEAAAWAIAGTTRWLGASTWSLRIAWKTSCWTDELLG